jgi:peroxiredoxin
MKKLKKTNLLILAAIMCVAIACAKENKEAGKATNSKKEIQVSKEKYSSYAKVSVKKKITKTVKTETPYQKKDTYFSLPNRNGGKIDLENYKGKPVALIFFANYCPYCHKAAPFMKKLHDTYTKKGLIVLGISADKNKDKANIFATKNNLNFPIAYNGTETSKQYKTRGVPYIFVLDKNHEIMDFWAGYDEAYDAAIIETIAEAIAK